MILLFVTLLFRSKFVFGTFRQQNYFELKIKGTHPTRYPVCSSHSFIKNSFDYFVILIFLILDHLPFPAELIALTLK